VNSGFIATYVVVLYTELLTVGQCMFMTSAPLESVHVSSSDICDENQEKHKINLKDRYDDFRLIQALS
jgi:hypothetical protein